MKRLPCLAAITVGAAASNAHADITAYTNFEAWRNASESITTLTFTEHPHGTHLTDQYSEFGIMFPEDDNHHVIEAEQFDDGHGLQGHDGSITFRFDEPQAWVGYTHFGLSGIELYHGSELVYANNDLGTSGGPGFSGVVSTDQTFDRVVLYRPDDSFPVMWAGEIHYGIPAPGAIAALALAGLFGGSRRRRPAA